VSKIIGKLKDASLRKFILSKIIRRRKMQVQKNYCLKILQRVILSKILKKET